MKELKVKLGEVAEIQSGFAFPSEQFGSESGMPLIRIRDIVRGHTDTKYRGIYDKRFVVDSGDLLIGMDGEFNVARWRGGQALLNQRVCRIKADSSRLDDSYLYHYLPRILKQIEAATPFVTVKHLSVRDVAEQQIPLPPLPEQRRIAAVLDRANALRAKRRATLAELDSLTQSIFLDLFGDPRKNQKKWDVVELGRLCIKLVDGTHKTPSYVTSGVPFITVRNMVTGALDFKNTKFITQDEHATLTKRVKPERGDILVSKDGTIGMACPVDTDREFNIFVSVALLKIKHQLIHQRFLTGQFRTDWIQSQIRAAIKGIAIRHLHLKDFKRLRILVPPLSLQKEFVRRLAAVEKVRASCRTSLGQMDALFDSVQHRAFRGEL